MVECAGGTWLKTIPRKAEENQFFLTCPEDKGEVEKLAKSGIKVVDREMLLSGLLKQTLDFKTYAVKNWIVSNQLELVVWLFAKLLSIFQFELLDFHIHVNKLHFEYGMLYQIVFATNV